MPRLFTGIEIPEPLRIALARLRQPMPGTRWVEPANFHVTLRFVGDVDNRVARELADFLGEIRSRAFAMRLDGLGAFGGSDPRIIWAGVDAGPDLEALARANERAVRSAGLAPEPRKFKPHITLARLQHARPDTVARFLERHGGFRSPSFRVSRFVLYSSRPQKGGGPYVIEDTYPLLGGQPEWAAEHDA